MREKLRDKGRLAHILQAISNISTFLEGKTAEDFLMNQMHQIDSRIVWQTIVNDLPLLKKQISGYIDELD